MRVKNSFVAVLMILVLSGVARGDAAPLALTRADYQDRVHAAWLGQIIGVLVTLPYEHKVSSVLPLKSFPKAYSAAMVDDDWYYEMVAVRAFEAHGPGLHVNQLGELWQKHNCGTWGSSKYALEAMKRGVKPEDAGLPKNNRLWFTIGPMFSCEIYGLLAPGDVNLAGKLARELGRINGHAEGLDAGVFSAAVVSAAFAEQDPREVVRQGSRLIDPQSPMRQALETVVKMAESGATFPQICNTIEDRWHIEYPATNNAVANGAILAACIWFAGGDFEKSMTLAGGAGDFVDADNIAAVACAVVGAMHGTRALPRELVAQLNDRVVGENMGGRMKLTPPVDESISELARRTAEVGTKVLAAHGATVSETALAIPRKPVVTQAAQLYRLAELTRDWNPDWTLERAGFGGGDGGMGGIRGMTYLDGDLLATYPRDEVRGLVLRRVVMPKQDAALTFSAGVDPRRAWVLEVYLDNQRVVGKTIEAPAGAKDRHWEEVRVDLSNHAGRPLHIRLFQRVLIEGKTAGNAYWKALRAE